MRSLSWSKVNVVAAVLVGFFLSHSTTPVVASQTSSAPAARGVTVGAEDAQGFFDAIVQGAVEGAVAGTVGGALIGAPIGATEGFIAGIYGGAVAGAVSYWLWGDDALFLTNVPKGKLPKTVLD